MTKDTKTIIKFAAFVVASMFIMPVLASVWWEWIGFVDCAISDNCKEQPHDKD